MKCKNYDYLIKNINANDEQEMYEIVNRRIDKLISNSENPKMTLEALISCFEGANNTSECFSLISIAYGLVIGIFSLFTLGWNEKLEKATNIFIFSIVFLVVVLVFVAFYSYKDGHKKGFILNVLKFRYEDIKKQEIKEKDNLNYSADEKIYIVKIKRNS